MNNKTLVIAVVLILCIAFSGCTLRSNEQDDTDIKKEAIECEEPETTLPTIYVPDTVAKPGDTVRAAVKIKNNPGILGMAISVYYDETVCTLKKVENGAALQDILNLTVSKELKTGARFIWDGLEIQQEDIQDGEILIMTFKINKKAEKGRCPITLKYFDNDIVNNDLVSLYPQIQNGDITIN